MKGAGCREVRPYQRFQVKDSFGQRTYVVLRVYPEVLILQQATKPYKKIEVNRGWFLAPTNYW